MKLKLALSLSALCFASSLFATPQVGQAAPAFTLMDSKGQSHSLADFAGKTVVLEWSNHECPFVVKHYSGNMQSLQKQFGTEEVVWLTLISSAPGKQGHISAAKADELTSSRNAMPDAVLFDETGVTGKAYDAKTTPHMYVIDKKGVLQYMGGIDSIPSAKVDDIAKATPYFSDALTAVLAGNPASPAVTKPYGCSIKY
ncbi:redoxin domain-containing protein [Rheinheimera sp.]|jgi:peroxiredoxin|uniref:redoxin domain-containing protein n=1 Tax=Rheinheimera sp. TaxID=1869214 RepID=UPI0026162CAA|nr:redoxin domain-containing protein [Rheinheimera sp.]MCA1930974.1 redoxin domain-containing protein [Rheinheimera sp.]